jgi:SRSO17 transposase
VQAAGIGEDTGFEPKPALARKMNERAVATGLPFGWFTADQAYGGNDKLREWLEASQIAYVVAVACDHRVPARDRADDPR